MAVRAIDHARIEARIGRKLTAAEQHVDVEAIDALLNKAKDDLEAAIRVEQRRVAKLIAQGHAARMLVTAAMLAVIHRLRADGEAHARAELASMGYPVKTGRRFASGDELEQRLRGRLGHLTIKVQNAAVGLDLSTISQDSIQRALAKVLGARGIAADFVSPAFDAGLADTFEQHTDLVEAWEYSSVLDAATCDPCAEHDGEQFDSWDAIQEVLPGGGPNPDCDGGDRCRCRAVPVPPDGSLARDTVPPNDNVDWTSSNALTIQGAQDALRSLESVHGLPAETPTVKVALNDQLSVANPGRYIPQALGGPKIELARDATDPGFTTLHEFGHYLSNMALGDPGGMPASLRDPDLAEWRQAIVESEAVKQFVAIGNGDVSIIADIDGVPVLVPVNPEVVFGYYLHPEELFARSYSQWAAIRSGDPQLMRELALARRSPYPEQWQEDDFAAIAAAFDRLIERLGWRTGTP